MIILILKKENNISNCIVQRRPNSRSQDFKIDIILLEFIIIKNRISKKKSVIIFVLLNCFIWYDKQVKYI